jgi:hypothetical protein
VLALISRVLDMTDSNSFIPSFSTIEHPRCPKCSVSRMNLARIAPGTGDFDIITFECSKCAHTLTISVDYDPMKSTKARWQHGSLKPSD